MVVNLKNAVFRKTHLKKKKLRLRQKTHYFALKNSNIVIDLFETNNFVFLRFFRISHIIVKKKKYASYEKILQFKFVGLYVENNIVS